MGGHFPKTGQKISVDDLRRFVVAEVGDPKLPQESVENILDTLDRSDADGLSTGKSDGYVTIGHLPIRQIVEEGFRDSPNHYSYARFSDVHDALLKKLGDARNPRNSSHDTQLFLERLQLNAYKSGVNLERADAEKIAEKMIEEDGRIDQKIAARKNWSLALTSQAQHFIRDQFKGKFSPENVEKIGYALAVTLDPHSEVREPKEIDLAVPYPRASSKIPGLATQNGGGFVTENGLALAMGGAPVDLIVAIDEYIPQIEALASTPESIQTVQSFRNVRTALANFVPALRSESDLGRKTIESLNTSIAQLRGYIFYCKSIPGSRAVDSKTALHIQNLSGTIVTRLNGTMMQMGLHPAARQAHAVANVAVTSGSNALLEAYRAAANSNSVQAIQRASQRSSVRALVLGAFVLTAVYMTCDLIAGEDEAGEDED